MNPSLTKADKIYKSLPDALEVIYADTICNQELIVIQLAYDRKYVKLSGSWTIYEEKEYPNLAHILPMYCLSRVDSLPEGLQWFDFKEIE